MSRHRSSRHREVGLSWWLRQHARSVTTHTSRQNLDLPLYHFLSLFFLIVYCARKWNHYRAQSNIQVTLDKKDTSQNSLKGLQHTNKYHTNGNLCRHFALIVNCIYKVLNLHVAQWQKVKMPKSHPLIIISRLPIDQPSFTLLRIRVESRVDSTRVSTFLKCTILCTHV